MVGANRCSAEPHETAVPVASAPVDLVPSGHLDIILSSARLVYREPRDGLLEWRGHALSGADFVLDVAPQCRTNLRQIHPKRTRVGSCHSRRRDHCRGRQSFCHFGTARHDQAGKRVRSVPLAFVRWPRSRPITQLLVPAMFTTHYADMFYSVAGEDRPLRFPNTPSPVFWDFAYFSFTIAAACQTADVLSTPKMRQSAGP